MKARPLTRREAGLVGAARRKERRSLQAHRVVCVVAGSTVVDVSIAQADALAVLHGQPNKPGETRITLA